MSQYRHTQKEGERAGLFKDGIRGQERKERGAVWGVRSLAAVLTNILAAWPDGARHSA